MALGGRHTVGNVTKSLPYETYWLAVLREESSYIYIHTYIFIHTTFIYMNIYSYIHTYIHTNMHTHISVSSLFSGFLKYLA